MIINDNKKAPQTKLVTFFNKTIPKKEKYAVKSDAKKRHKS